MAGSQDSSKLGGQLPTLLKDGIQRQYFDFTEFGGVALNALSGADRGTACRVYLPPDAGSKFTKDMLETFPAYREWLNRFVYNLGLQYRQGHVFHSDPYRLLEIDIQAVTWFGSKIGFLKLQCEIKNSSSDNSTNWLPGAVFLRGGSVGVLCIFQPYDPVDPDKEQEKYAVLVIQPRIPSGSFAFAEIPAGMLDDKSGDITGKAVQELEEEVGIYVDRDELTNMSELAVQDVPQKPWAKDAEDTATMSLSEWVADSMYPSVGGCDEFMPLMLLQKRLYMDEFKSLQDKKTGERHEGERITLKLVPFKSLWKYGGRDAKCLAALSLYENLQREGHKGLKPMPDKPDDPELVAAKKKARMDRKYT